MSFNISRHMSEELIKLELVTEYDEMSENGNPEKWRILQKEKLLSELVEVLDPHARIGNKKKLLTDFVNRERKASTAVGEGFAVPHIRSMQAKEFMIAYARSTIGYEFESPDNLPVHHFFVMASPPYDDNLYLKVFKAVSELVQFGHLGDKLMQASEPYDVIRAIKDLE